MVPVHWMRSEEVEKKRSLVRCQSAPAGVGRLEKVDTSELMAEAHRNSENYKEDYMIAFEQLETQIEDKKLFET